MSISHRIVIFLIAATLLSACSMKSYPPIQENVSIAATVNIKDKSITFIDIDSQEKLAEWEMEKPYTGAVILPDKDTILLYGKHVETADLYSLKMGKLIDTWETGEGIINGKMLQTNAEIALVDQNLDKIRFFNIDGEEQWQMSTERDPLTILEAEKSKHLFVLSFNREKLTVIDLDKKEKLNGYPIHPSAAGAWLNENLNEIWIGGHGSGAEIEKDIHVYDSLSGQFKRKIPAPSMPVNFLGINNQVFVLSHGTSMLYKLNEMGEVINSVIIGANPFDCVYINGQLLIAGYDSNDLHIVNPETLEIIKTIPVGSGPFQIVLRERKS
ncbi:YncE family protein [Cytobacillus sp. FJAT-53684]|uniref:YncE family protein n=1 Tax=Cytobacillus mangrovibacter TaxID=3299024 RepID=A0ABW6JYK1_9BACI